MTAPLAITPGHNNANRGTLRGHRVIARSLQARGAGRSGLAAKDGSLIAGNQTYQEVAALGIPIREVHTVGDEWVVVVRDDLEPDSEAAVLLGLEDNRATQVGLDFDPALLAALSKTMDLTPLWEPEELRALQAQQQAIAPTDFQEADESIETQYQCPKCQYAWSGKPK